MAKSKNVIKFVRRYLDGSTPVITEEKDTFEEINAVNAFPDNEFPLRILRSYLYNSQSRIVSNPPSIIADVMNDAQERREKILANAIKILEDSLEIDCEFNEDKKEIP